VCVDTHRSKTPRTEAFFRFVTCNRCCINIEILINMDRWMIFNSILKILVYKNCVSTSRELSGQASCETVVLYVQ
jgi:hypothetical protein